MIVEYKTLNQKQQEEFKNIYLNSFPENERRPIERILKDLDAENYLIYLYIIEEKVVAFASVYAPQNFKLSLLDYFAVGAELRGKGLGGNLFRSMIGLISKLKRTLILEVEDPSFGDDAISKAKRIQFYQNNGAVLISNYNYLLPDLDGNGQKTQMKIMIAPEEKINRGEFSDFIKIIFKE
jgi:hypothetical protein